MVSWKEWGKGSRERADTCREEAPLAIMMMQAGRRRAGQRYGEDHKPMGLGGGEKNTTMLGHLDTEIRSAPPAALTEAELEAAGTVDEEKASDAIFAVQTRAKAAVSLKYIVHPQYVMVSCVGKRKKPWCIVW